MGWKFTADLDHRAGTPEAPVETTEHSTSRAPRAALPTWIWPVTFAIAGAAAGWPGDAIWEIAVAGLCALVGWVLGVASLAGAALGSSRTDRPTRTSSAVAFALVQGVGLGLSAWLFSLLAWFALQIALGGRTGWFLLVISGALVGAGVGWIAAWASRRRTATRFRRWLLGGTATVALVLVLLFLLLTGPHELSRYPPAANSPYRLPWPAGVTRLCTQSNRGIVSHRGTEEFAYDFAMPVGSDVCATRAGVVRQVTIDHDGNGFNAPNNFVFIDHEDGTFAYYGHLKRGGSYVAVGDVVQQGQRIAASGHVGHSLLPHLHFHVSSASGGTIPITFADVTSDAGIPRMFRRYTSGNTTP
jgi:hypothetical protein